MAQKPSQEFISGPPTGASEGIRKVEIQNASSKLWVYGIKLEDDPNYVGPGIIANADSVQPNPTQQWKLVLVDRDVHHYRVQNIGTHKYASVGEPPEKGSNISQDDTARLWKITEDGQSHYMFTPVGEAEDKFFWTDVKGEDGEPISVTDFEGGAEKSRWRLRDVKSESS